MNGGVLVVGKDIRLDAIVYKIPGETRTYKITGETRIYKIRSK
jgi:hypothetical protein